MRVALDTNVLIAAVTNPQGDSARVVRLWREGRVEVVASEATLREAELVLGGGWLARLRPGGDVGRLLEDLRERSVRVEGEPIADLRLKDEGDRRLVEAAVAGGARYVVTTDREFLRQRGYGGTQFVAPAEFLRALKREALA